MVVCLKYEIMEYVPKVNPEVLTEDDLLREKNTAPVLTEDVLKNWLNLAFELRI